MPGSADIRFDLARHCLIPKLLPPWDFGDGATSTDPSVSHDDAAPGTYDVTLTVRDEAGNTNTVMMTVEVRAVSPKATELLAAIQGLWVGILVLLVLLIIVGLIALDNYRKSRPPKKAAYGTALAPHGALDMHVLPPPPPAPPTG